MRRPPFLYRLRVLRNLIIRLFYFGLTSWHCQGGCCGNISVCRLLGCRRIPCRFGPSCSGRVLSTQNSGLWRTGSWTWAQCCCSRWGYFRFATSPHLLVDVGSAIARRAFPSRSVHDLARDDADEARLRRAPHSERPASHLGGRRGRHSLLAVVPGFRPVSSFCRLRPWYCHLDREAPLFRRGRRRTSPRTAFARRVARPRCLSARTRACHIARDAQATGGLLLARQSHLATALC